MNGQTNEQTNVAYEKPGSIMSSPRLLVGDKSIKMGNDRGHIKFSSTHLKCTGNSRPSS